MDSANNNSGLCFDSFWLLSLFGVSLGRRATAGALLWVPCLMTTIVATDFVTFEALIPSGCLLATIRTLWDGHGNLL